MRDPLAHGFQGSRTTPPGGTGTGDEVAAISARALAEKPDAVPGIGPATAQIILAETGADMSRFPTPQDLVSCRKRDRHGFQDHGVLYAP
jgi:transposase